MARAIDALNDKMKVLDVRIFGGRLRPAARAMSLRAQLDGEY